MKPWWRIVAVFLATGCVCAWADIDLPTPPPPQPRDLAVQVYKGESVEIPLEGLSRSGYQLKFLIRRQPQFGTLSEPTQTGRTTASIIYTHDGANGVGVDAFRYAVQAPNTGVSTPATVTIRIVERPPLFVAPHQVEFPKTSIGETSTQVITIGNEGGGTLSGRLKVPPPFSILGDDPTYILPSGETRTFVLSFAPTESRRYAEAAEFTHAPGVEIGLEGIGYSPIEVVPREIRLEGDGVNEVRSATVTVRNTSARDRALELTAPPGVVVQGSLTVPADDEVQLALHTATGVLESIHGDLELRGENVHLNVPIFVTAAPARIVANPRDEIDFGTVQSGRTATRTLTLRNTGGQDAEIRATVMDGVTIHPSPEVALLAPGESRDYKLAFTRLQPGAVSGELLLQFGAGRLTIPLRAEVEPRPVDAAAQARERTAQAAANVNSIPPVESVGVSRQTHTEVDLVWKKTAPNVDKYILYERKIEFSETGEPQFVYRPVEGARVRFVRNEARVTVKGFRPGERRTFIIFGLDAAGTRSQPSEPFEIFSKPKKAFQIPWGTVAMVALVVFVVIIVRERRRLRRAQDVRLEGIERY